MAKGRGRIRVLTPFTDTVGLRFNNWRKDAFVPGWDKSVNGDQQVQRVKDRAEMGDIMTPRGKGVAVRTKG